MAAFSEYVSFAVLDLVNINPVVANIVSFIIGLAVSFMLNKQWVFGVDGRTGVRLVKYLILAGINLLLGSVLLHLLIYDMHIPSLLAKAVIMIMIASWNYAVFSKIIFKQQD